MTPRASIVTTLYGGRPVTERFLASLETALGEALGTDFELILVDNASPDDTGELLDRWEARATVIRNAENLNFGGGNNVGAQTARGDVLLLLNNDTEFPPGTLEALVEEAMKPEVAAAGCRLLYPNGTLQHAGIVFFPAPPGGTPVPFHLFRHEAGDLPAAGGILHLDAVTGAALAMRRELFLRLGGFDEQYVNGYEDVDLLLRARVETGGRIVYRGDVAGVHHEGLARGKRETDTANHDLFFTRWGDLIGDDAETFQNAFGARFSPFGRQVMHPNDEPTGSPLVFRGALLGIGPENDEARALLAVAERAGLEPGVREVPLCWVVPGVHDLELLHVQSGHQRAVGWDAPTVTVPVGEWPVLPTGPLAVLRLARVPDGGVPDAGAVWAATETLVDDLVAAGAPPERTACLPPAVEAPLGDGGGGVLAVLPVHAPELADRLLEALAQVHDVPVRVAPTVGGPATAALVAERLPAAELLGAVSAESTFAAFAGQSDVVVAVDPADPYGRRALVTAAAGAAPVALDRGAARDVLGRLLHDAGPDASAIGAAITAALADTTPRAERAAAVAAVCAPDAVAARLRELVEAFEASRPAPQFDVSRLAR